MSNKAKILRFIEELKSRSTQSYGRILTQMQLVPELQMSKDVFQNKFRRFPERRTKYSPSDIVYLIQLFTDKAGKVVCTPFEALLLCEWSGIGRSANNTLQAIYDPKAFKVAQAVANNKAIDFADLDWFDNAQRQYVEELLAYTQYKFEDPDQRPPLDMPYLPTSYQRLTLSPPPIDEAQIDELPELYYKDIARLLDQATLDLKRGYLMNAGNVLVKLLHKANYKHLDQVRDIHHQIGIYYIKQGQHDLAYQSLEKALTFTSDTDAVTTAIIYGNLGTNAHYRGDYDISKDYYQIGLPIAQHAQEQQVISFIQNGLGIIAMETGNYSEAQLRYDDAFTNAKKANDIDRLGYANLNLGIAHVFQEHYSIAQPFLENGLKFAEQVNNNQLAIHISWYIGILQIMKGNILQGEYKLKQAAIFAHDNKFGWLYIYIMLELGKLYIQQHKITFAQRSIHEALYHALSIQNLKLINLALYGMALASLIENDIIGSNNIQSTIRNLYMLTSIPLIHSLKSDQIRLLELYHAERYFQRNLLNFPNLKRYKIPKALILMFSDHITSL